MEEQKNISAIDVENTLAAPEEPAKKPGLVRGARDFIENTLSTLKGKDMNQAVEEFTGEMTLVIEGLSEDMDTLRHDVEQTAAQLTIFENDLMRLNDDRGQDMAALRRDMEGLVKRMNALEKALKDKRALKKNTVTGALRQATWLVGIFSAAWVIVTLLKLIGG